MNLQRVKSLVKRDLKKLVREPAALFMIILFPLVLTLIFGASFGKIGGTQDITFTTGVVNTDTEGPFTLWAQSFAGNMSSTGLLEIQHYSYNETAQDDLSQGKIQAVVVIPDDFGESCSSFWGTPADPSKWVNTTVQLYVDSGSMVATQAIPPIIQQALRTTIYGEQPIVQEPIQLGSPSMVQTETLTTFDYFVPGLFAFAAIFLIMTVGESFTLDREKGLLRRINTTPTTATEFMSSQAMSNMVAAVLQIIIIFAMAFLMGYRPLGDAASMVMAVVIVLVFSLCCVGFGLVTATIAKTPGSATGIAFIFIMPQMFLGTFVSVGLSPVMQTVGRFVPAWYVTDALTSLFLRGAPATSTTILIDLVVVVAMSIAVLLVGILLFKRYGKA